VHYFKALGPTVQGTSVGTTSTVRAPSRSYCSLSEIKRHDFGIAYFVSFKKRKVKLKGILKTKIKYLKEEATLEMGTGQKQRLKVRMYQCDNFKRFPPVELHAVLVCIKLIANTVLVFMHSDKNWRSPSRTVKDWTTCYLDHRHSFTGAILNYTLQ